MIAFTFPHIGNVGANDEDVEAGEAHALGCLVREVVTEPSNYRANQGFADWMAKWGRIGIAGVDTRALTKLVRSEGPPTIAIAHRADGQFDLEALQRMAARLAGARGHGPGEGGQPAAGRALERGQVGRGMAPLPEGRGSAATFERVATPLTKGIARTSSRSIMATSATSSASWSRPGRG